jgi:hypothetical protein
MYLPSFILFYKKSQKEAKNQNYAEWRFGKNDGLLVFQLIVRPCQVGVLKLGSLMLH